MEAKETLKEMLQPTPDLPPSFLVSATYSGESRRAVLKFYSPDTEKVYLWYDQSGHSPYCYTRLPTEQLGIIKGRGDVTGMVRVKKLDLLNDREVEVTKIVATDPLAIGGSPSENSIRNIIEAWEADIKYYENYLYDAALIPGTLYEIRDSKIIATEHQVPAEVRASLEEVITQSSPDFVSHITEWARLLSFPLPTIRRAALDIEVATPEENRVPDAREAQYPVVAVSIVGSDGVQEVYVLRRPDVPLGNDELPKGARVIFFDTERDLIRRVFEQMTRYPFIMTFNGDDFDLSYLYHRALPIGLSKDDVPIAMGKDVAHVRHGVHIDLYKTFINRSLQVYAFGNKYVEHTLNRVSEGLLGESKIKFEGPLASLPLYQLARYCHKDALLTYGLTSFDGDLLMKLLFVIMRIAKMPIDDVARLGVSNWIRSMMYFEHRRINALIPRSEELNAKGGAYSRAITKGKKYKGGLVVEPRSGIHFNISVLDFASLYPSIIKVDNLSYETVRCVHGECRDNLVPETDHWVCRKRRGIFSLIIGSLRDLRVNYYKPLSRDPRLTSSDRNLYHVISQALKVILNASYGVTGAEIFPLYCLPVAEATTAIGRDVISKTITKCRDIAIDVIYGDTDSLFLSSPTEAQIRQVSGWAEKELGIELDLDKVYRFVVFSERKKNYLGVLSDGNVDIKGLTGKKSHVPPFIRKAFYDAVGIVSHVRSPQDFEVAREEIRKKVRSVYLDLKNKRIPIEDLAFNVMVGKSLDRYIETTPQHVRAAKLLIDRGRTIKAGDIISFVKTATPPGVKPTELATVDEIDQGKYLDYLRSTFDQFLGALGYEFDEILGATKLEDFFWGQSS